MEETRPDRKHLRDTAPLWREERRKLQEEQIRPLRPDESHRVPNIDYPVKVHSRPDMYVGTSTNKMLVRYIEAGAEGDVSRNVYPLTGDAPGLFKIGTLERAAGLQGTKERPLEDPARRNRSANISMRAHKGILEATGIPAEASEHAVKKKKGHNAGDAYTREDRAAVAHGVELGLAEDVYGGGVLTSHQMARLKMMKHLSDPTQAVPKYLGSGKDIESKKLPGIRAALQKPEANRNATDRDYINILAGSWFKATGKKLERGEETATESEPGSLHTQILKRAQLKKTEGGDIATPEGRKKIFAHKFSIWTRRDHWEPKERDALLQLLASRGIAGD